MKEILEEKLGLGAEKNDKRSKFLGQNKFENLELKDCHKQMQLLSGGYI